MKVKSEINFQFSASASGDANVDQHDQQSLAKWALILGVTKEELLQAVKEHGHLIRDIRKGMRNKKKDHAA
jgi:predicted transcriptional regulator